MRILIVDDEQANVEYFSRALQQYETVPFTDTDPVIEYCRSHSFDVVIADQKMPRKTGIELIQELQTLSGEFLGIIVSAYTDVPDLVEAVNSNVIYKYIVKPFSPDILLQHVRRGIEALELRKENILLTEELKKENKALRVLTENPLDAFIGFHPEVEKMKERAKMYAQSDFPVLISGETGTGKELVARAIHKLSKRRDKNFIAVNCSAFSEQLLESELFGYAKGAFTGADTGKKGLIDEAAGGTLFLDEIGDFPLNLQPKILRFIQFGTFYPIGSTKEQHVDVRIISATNKDLQKAAAENTFRSDLLFRVNSLHISTIPLRDRPKDIIFIMEALAARRGIILPDFSEGAKRLVQGHRFPGNVRELESIIEKIHLHSRTHTMGFITETFIAECAGFGTKNYTQEEHPEGPSTDSGSDSPFSLHEYLADVEKTIIERYFTENNYNITRTAAAVGVSRQGLKNKFRRYGIPFGGYK